MISTHILDTSIGMPAPNVEVSLEVYVNEEWTHVDNNKTNDDGRIAFNCPNEAGTYRLKFEVDKYYEEKGVENFFVRTPVIFKIKDTNRKYHVPLLLNPFGYSTYRGS
jgi:5-hydroxyisourate hydrolase